MTTGSGKELLKSIRRRQISDNENIFMGEVVFSALAAWTVPKFLPKNQLTSIPGQAHLDRLVKKGTASIDTREIKIPKGNIKLMYAETLKLETPGTAFKLFSLLPNEVKMSIVNAYMIDAPCPITFDEYPAGTVVVSRRKGDRHRGLMLATKELNGLMCDVKSQPVYDYRKLKMLPFSGPTRWHLSGRLINDPLFILDMAEFIDTVNDTVSLTSFADEPLVGLHDILSAPGLSSTLKHLYLDVVPFMRDPYWAVRQYEMLPGLETFELFADIVVRPNKRAFKMTIAYGPLHDNAWDFDSVFGREASPSMIAMDDSNKLLLGDEVIDHITPYLGGSKLELDRHHEIMLAMTSWDLKYSNSFPDFLAVSFSYHH